MMMMISEAPPTCCFGPWVLVHAPQKLCEEQKCAALMCLINLRPLTDSMRPIRSTAEFTPPPQTAFLKLLFLTHNYTMTTSKPGFKRCKQTKYCVLLSLMQFLHEQMQQSLEKQTCSFFLNK